MGGVIGLWTHLEGLAETHVVRQDASAALVALRALNAFVEVVPQELEPFALVRLGYSTRGHTDGAVSLRPLAERVRASEQ